MAPAEGEFAEAFVTKAARGIAGASPILLTILFPGGVLMLAALLGLLDGGSQILQLAVLGVVGVVAKAEGDAVLALTRPDYSA